MLSMNQIKINNEKSVQLHQQIGQGSISKVFKGVLNVNIQSFPVAVKVVTRQTMNGGHNQYFEKEIEISEKIMKYQQNKECPFITKIYDIVFLQNEILIISEFCTLGDFYSFQCSYYQDFNEKLTTQMFYQIIYGIEQLHEIGIIHRDLKPENILITQQNEQIFIKLGDFGISSFSQMAKSQVGTINYMAIEILQNQYYDCAVDIWSFGCIAYEILNNEQLFNDTSQVGVARKILNFREDSFQNKINFKYPFLMNIIYQCMKVDPKLRLNAKQIRIQLEKRIQQLENPNYSENYQNQSVVVDIDDLEGNEEEKCNLNQSSPAKFSNTNHSTHGLENGQLQKENCDQDQQNVHEDMRKSSVSSKISKRQSLVQSIKVSGLEDSQSLLKRKREKQDNALNLIINREKNQFVDEKEFISRSFFYLVYCNSIQNFQKDTKIINNDNALIYFILILVDLITTDNIQNIYHLFNTLNLNQSPQEMKLNDILRYILSNCLLNSENFEKRQKYFINEVTRVNIVKSCFEELSKLKMKEIFSYNMSEEQIIQNKAVLSKHIPSSKLKQLFNLFNRKSVIVPFLVFTTLYYLYPYPLKSFFSTSSVNHVSNFIKKLRI